MNRAWAWPIFVNSGGEAGIVVYKTGDPFSMVTMPVGEEDVRYLEVVFIK